MNTAIRYREVAAPAPVCSHVLNYWEFIVDRLDEDVYHHHVPPDGCVSIVVRYSRDEKQPLVLCVGPRVDTFNVDVTDRDHYFGMRFWPYVASAMLGAALQQSVGQVGLGVQFLPILTQELTKQLPKIPDAESVMAALTNVAVEILPQCPPFDPLIREAVNHIVTTKGCCTVAALADVLDISQRQLQRRFRASTGLTPKMFARVRRFRNAAAELLVAKPRPWATVAYEAGYADQSHLAREFSQMIGLTAQELVEKHAVIEHDNVDP